MNHATTVTLLEQMGLTPLEAQVYIHLLQSPPATGYGIAKAIGKPTANTYKAIDSLTAKGAILADDAPTRQYRATPVSDFLSSYGERQKKLGERVSLALTGIERTWSDDRVYQLSTVDQVMQGCRRMIKDAKRVILFDLFPKPMADLGGDLERAAKRGVQVVVKIYSPVILKRVDVLLPDDPEVVLSRWPGQWVNGVVDGREHQLAFLSQDMTRVYQAIWSTSEYLSWMYHNGIASEFVHTAIGAVLRSGGSVDDIAEVYEKYRGLLTMDAPGYASLMRRFGAGASATNSHKKTRHK